MSGLPVHLRQPTTDAHWPDMFLKPVQSWEETDLKQERHAFIPGDITVAPSTLWSTRQPNKTT